MRNFTVPMLALAFGGVFQANAQNARLQVIHNSADAAAEFVDVYVNDEPLLNDFEFRTATQFIDVPAGVELEIVVAPGNSTSSEEGIYTLNTTLTEDETYIIVANGIVSTDDYTPNQPFQLSVFAGGRESALGGSGTDILVNHGSTDAPTVDVVETSVPVGTVINDISYPSFAANYLEVVTADYILDVTDETGMTVVASYQVPLETLELDGAALTVVASGFLNPDNNSDGPAFGLWVATAAGGDLIELPLANQTARVQVIHNSADAAAEFVDVYVNDEPLLNDFEFRTATSFIDVPAGVALEIVVAPGTSTSSEEGIYTLNTTLTEDETYIIVANGIVSTMGYNPNQPFNLYVYPMGREEASQAGNTDVLVFHGATDAPIVDVQAVGAGTIVEDLAYGDFNDYLELATDDYVLSVATADGSTVVASYEASLETLELDGAALTVIASGFLNQDNNNDGPAFGLWAALTSGGPLVELPLTTLSATGFEAAKATLYPNPATDYVTVGLQDTDANMTHVIFDASGRRVLTATGSTIDLASLSGGVYMLQSTNYGNITTQKLIKK